jgi:transposase-like protein
MTKYPNAFKERVVREYKKGERGKGFAALSKRFKVPKSVIQDWWKQWVAGGRTIEAFEDRAGGDRRSLLTEREKERYIVDFVSLKNHKGEAVDYTDVHQNVVKKTKKEVSLPTVQRLGKEECNLTWKCTTQTLESEESNFPEAVSKYRRKAQEVAKEKMVFLDGTGMGSEPRRTHGLAPAGKKAKVKTKKAKRYQSRLDIWGAISYNKPLALDIKTAQDRKEAGVKGYGKKWCKLFIREKMAPEVAKIRQNVIVGMDRGFHFTPDEIEEELKRGGAHNLDDVWIFPANGGKLCNPLDNTLWHSMKARVRKSHPVDENRTIKAIKKAFMGTSAKDIHSYYRKCALTKGSDPYKDLND